MRRHLVTNTKTDRALTRAILLSFLIFLSIPFNAPAMPVDIETARIRSAALSAVRNLFPKEAISLRREDRDHYLATVAGCRLPVLVRDTPYSGRRRYGPRIFDILLGPPKC